MSYSVDLKKITIEEYRQILQKQDLLPGRRILLEDLDRHFDAILAAGMDSLSELKQALSNPQKIASFAVYTAIPEDYLNILRRQIGSLEPRPVRLKDMPGSDPELILALDELGIRNSQRYYDTCQKQGFETLSQQVGFSAAVLQELFELCSLVRINGVGGLAARIFHDAGFCRVADIAAAEPEALLEGFKQINASKKYEQVTIGEKDARFCIENAELLLKLDDETPKELPKE